MAEHIHCIKDSKIPVVTKDEFWASLREGQLMFCSGSAHISHAIECLTASPWSHITRIVRIYDEWCVLEAVYPHGVTITPLWQYVDRYPGDLVLASVDGDQLPAIKRGLVYLGRDYASIGLVKEELHRIFTKLPPETNGTDCYCSGLQWLMSMATPRPFQSPKGGAPAPEDIWTDPTVTPVCARVLSAAVEVSPNPVPGNA